MLATLLASIATGELAKSVRRVRAAVVAYAIAGAALLCGVGFLIGAGFVASAARYGSFNSALGFAVGFLVLGLFIIVFHRISSRVHARRAAERRAGDLRGYAGAAAVALLPVLMKSKPGLVGLLAPILAAAAYAIYKENVGGTDRTDFDHDKP
jgi:high-affinity Fe2+/Pb2+ permease